MTNKTNSQEMNGRTAYSGTSEQMKGGNKKMKLKNILVKGALIAALSAGAVSGFRGCRNFLTSPTEAHTAEIDGKTVSYQRALKGVTLTVKKDDREYEFLDNISISEERFHEGVFNRNATVEEVVVRRGQELERFVRGRKAYEEPLFEQADRIYNSLRERLYEKLKTEAQERVQKIVDDMPK